MKHKIFLVIFFLLTLSGCAAYHATLDEIRADQQAYFQQSHDTSQTIEGTIKNVIPINPDAASVICIVLGYGICFARKWYQNYKRMKANTKL